MQKLMDYLEKYVEWVALGLGGLFLLYMLWGYVLNMPVTVQVDNRPVSPGKVDSLIVDGPIQKLDQAMKDTWAPKMEVQPFAQQFATQMAHKNFAATELALRWLSSEPARFRADSGTTVRRSDGTRVVELPKLPPAQPSGTASGKSTVLLPAAAPSPAGAAPALTAAPGTPGAPVTMREEDRLWVTQSFIVPMEAIGQEFARVKVPATLTTVFLNVEMVRQEMNDDGEWGPETPVKPLAIYNPPALPRNGPPPAEYAYLDWAGRNTAEIIMPAFYQRVRGDIWWTPGTADPNKPVKPTVVFDPANPGKPLSQMTPEERAQYNEFQQKKAAEEARRRAEERRNRPRPAPRPRSGAPRFEPSYLPTAAAERGTQVAQAAPHRPGIPSIPPPGFPPGMEPGMEPGMPPMNPMQPGQPVAPPIQGARPGFTAPAGAFNPAQVGQVEVWVHDDQVQPDKTYRYRMRYRLKNPIYATVNVADPQKLAQVFILESAWSEWTAPVHVEPISYLFLAGGILRDSVKFDIFKWQNGQWQKQKDKITAAPGDAIGTVEAGVDFTTGWVLVDVRSNMGQDPYVLLVHEGDDRLVRRDYNTDQADKRRQELETFVRETPKTASAG